VNTVVLTGTVTQPILVTSNSTGRTVRFTVALPLSYMDIENVGRQPCYSVVECLARNIAAGFAADLIVGQEVAFRLDAIINTPSLIQEQLSVFVVSKVKPGIKPERYAPHTKRAFQRIRCISCPETFANLRDCEHHICPGDLNPHIVAPPCECLREAIYAKVPTLATLSNTDE